MVRMEVDDGTRKRAMILAKGSWLDGLLKAKGYYLQGRGKTKAAKRLFPPRRSASQAQASQAQAPPRTSRILQDISNTRLASSNNNNESGGNRPSDRHTMQVVRRTRSPWSCGSKGSSMGSSEPLRVKVKRADMAPDAVALAVQVATDAIQLSGVDNHRDIAKTLKEEFDRELSPAWQCIVGQRFGSFITHAEGTFVYFIVGDLAILLFRTIPASCTEADSSCER
ncbi:putative light chain of dynein [Chloropicon primus]|uniref:Dynein light chain 1, cytoplasmic n=1 Tax=Chloropicon primus TaxID=1764295 RepID=A0A5B8MZA5_9CHLO|nr:putative light chain of dynein [Chloropicon primus]UPR05104.1 putative light chain of dynein [Chloropicon primus]|eukprot:QDZ25903.1 putative light chain of dynein [Chloropicon primus]